ncbi:ecdysteroid 22-kinase family protein [Verrucomicrobiales bacterium]|nr:ecdysteroid 22-kinase family protein [Verrucomicrobiales bacterium]
MPTNSLTHLGEKFESVILKATGASAMRVESVIQELWSGYGQILRIALTNGDREHIVAKHIVMPQGSRHPRGWNSNFSHERKVFSYKVETEWYQSWSTRCDDQCRIPEFLSFARNGENILLVLEDLDASGFPSRRTALEWNQIELCLKWLAEFHATFLGEIPSGLWDTGTYWHLETRPEEFDALDDEPLKAAAATIDQKLSAARFQTFVHGDAKLANFCFSENRDEVAMLDFQYVGGGCGMKDVAYFIGSCLDEDSCEAQEGALLTSYFASLETALNRRRPDIDANAVITEWRELFPVAWTDFHRFLKGWCPGHWKINSYSERVARKVLERL